MSGNEIAALVVAITGALAAIFAGIRNLRSDNFKHDVDASAALLSGYTGMVQTLQAQITRMEEAHRADREEWLRERAEWQREKGEIRRQHLEEVEALNDRIDELGTQVWALQNRPITTREREDDTK